MGMDIYTWDSEVRGYELDLQGIVNNAHYLHYFDHVRIKHLYSKGIDWCVWHDDGFDLVLIHVDLAIKSSLRANDEFYITSKIERLSKLKILFDQKIYRKTDDKLIAEARNTVVCVSNKTSRPVFPDKLQIYTMPRSTRADSRIARAICLRMTYSFRSNSLSFKISRATKNCRI